MTWQSRLQSCLEGFVGQFMRDSSVHGMKFMGYQKHHAIERLFWAIGLLGGLFYSVILIEQILEKRAKDPIIVSYVPEESAVSQIPFPALTLCNVNILKDEMVQEATRLYSERLYESEEERNDSARELAYNDALALMEHMFQVNFDRLFDVTIIAHYCLAAPSIRRKASLPIRGFNGTRDFVTWFQEGLIRYIDSGGISENFADNVTKEYRRNLTEFFTKASHKCDDMILRCIWASEEVPCRSIFRPIMTQHGSCCVFNMMPRFILRKIRQNSIRVQEEKKFLQKETITAWESFTEDLLLRNVTDSPPKHPFYQKTGGKTNGLSILINPEMNTYSTCNANDGWGLKMVAHSPISFPSVIEFGMAVPHSSEVFVNIEPKVTLAEKGTIKNFPIEERGCFFRDDAQSHLETYRYYTEANCWEECVANHTFEKCGCVRYFMPRKPKQKLCGAKKLDCSENAMKEVITSDDNSVRHCDHCKPSCISVRYKMRETEFPIRKGSGMSSIFYNSTSKEELQTASNYSILHVFLESDTFNALERKQLYNMWDLLGKIGGILGVTLGFSIICGVELFYSFTFRAWRYFRSRVVEGDDEVVGDEVVSVDDYYASSRPRFSAIVKRKRVMRSGGRNKINPFMSLANSNAEIPPFHLLEGFTVLHRAAIKI